MSSVVGEGGMTYPILNFFCVLSITCVRTFSILRFKGDAWINLRLKVVGAGRPHEVSVPVVDEAVTDAAGVAGVLGVFGVLGKDAGLIGERGHLSLGLEVSTDEDGENIGETVLLR